MASPVFVIAQQRSGTNLLRRGLASTPWFVDRDEIFHSDPVIGSFWTHRALMIAKDPTLSIPHIDHQNHILDSYLETFSSKGDKFTLFDVKYNSLHSMNPIWQNHGLRPHLITYLAQKRIPVIHLIRKDSLAAYISTVISNDTKMYVTRFDTVSEGKKWSVNPLQLIRYLRELKFDIQRTQNWLNLSVNIKWTELTFESLLNDQGNFSRQILGPLEELLKIPEPLEPRVMTKKIINRPYWELIDNFESEVIPALREKGYEEYIPDAFRAKNDAAQKEAA